MKYNLTIWQWLEVPFLWITWYFHADKSKRKATFHLVKKGLEKHEHKYTIHNPYPYKGKIFEFWDCEHEGCDCTSPDKTEPTT